MNKVMKLNYLLRMTSFVIDNAGIEYSLHEENQITPKQVFETVSLIPLKYSKCSLSNAISNRIILFSSTWESELNKLSQLTDISENRLDVLISDFVEISQQLFTELSGDVPISDFLILENDDIDY